jgi:hypothetical protein
MIAVIVALRSLSAAAELVAVVSGAMSRSPVALPHSRIRRERVGNVRAGRRKWTATL